MSRSDDYSHEMSAHAITDEAAEAFFSRRGHPWWEQDESLVALADHVSLAVGGPAPRPNHALLQMFWASPSPAPAPEAEVAPSLGKRLRVATAALVGTFVALTGVGVAGAAGVLPAPVEGVVARVIETVTPFEVPEGDGSGDPRGAERTDAPPAVPPAPAPSPQPPVPAPTPAPGSPAGTAPANRPPASVAPAQPPYAPASPPAARPSGAGPPEFVPAPAGPARGPAPVSSRAPR